MDQQGTFQDGRASNTADARGVVTVRLPRWAPIVLIGGAGVVALVMLGIVPASVALYGAMFGGMALMHLGGHGAHGGHGGDSGQQGSGHARHDSSGPAAPAGATAEKESIDGQQSHDHCH